MMIAASKQAAREEGYEGRAARVLFERKKRVLFVKRK
jgi:hypothetical protein